MIGRTSTIENTSGATPQTLDNCWKRVQEKMREIVGPLTVAEWFGSVRVASFFEGTVTLGVSTNFLKHWIEKHYLPQLLTLWQHELAVSKVVIVVRTPVRVIAESSLQRSRMPLKKESKSEGIIPFNEDGEGACKHRIPFLKIQKTVASHFGLSIESMLSPKRTSTVTLPRHIAIYLSAQITGKSLSEIGRRFCRDHATVLEAVRKIQHQMEQDHNLYKTVHLLAQKILTELSAEAPKTKMSPR